MSNTAMTLDCTLEIHDLRGAALRILANTSEFTLEVREWATKSLINPTPCDIVGAYLEECDWYYEVINVGDKGKWIDVEFICDGGYRDCHEHPFHLINDFMVGRVTFAGYDEPGLWGFEVEEGRVYNLFPIWRRGRTI